MEDGKIRLDEINIKGLIKDIIKGWWLIILAAVSSLFLLYAYYVMVYTPMYTSNATLVVSAKGSGSVGAYADLVTTTEMANVFKDVFGGSVLKNKVAQTAGINTSEFKISAQTIPETNILILSVSGEEPQIVYEAINCVLDVYPEVSDYIFSNAVLDVLEDPMVPTSPSNVFYVRKSQKMLVQLSVIIMVVAISIVSLIRKTVKTQTAADRRIKGNKLSVIGHEVKYKSIRSKIRRKGKAILITSPLTNFAYVETFRKLSFRIDNDMQRKGCKTLLVSSTNENEGKSTVAANLAIALAQMNKNVLLVDLDLKKPALYKIFNKESGKNEFWNDEVFLSGKNKLDLLLNKNRTKKSVNLLKSKKVLSVVEWAKENYDYVILDSPPLGVAADAEIISSYSDAVVMVIRQDYSLVSEINRNIDTISQLNTHYLGYILNDFDEQGFLGKGQYGYGYEKYKE